MRPWRSMALALALLSAVQPPYVHATDSEILAFADHLFEEGDYSRAITEYRRYRFLNPENSLAAFSDLRIALSYLEAGNTDEAFPLLDGIAGDADTRYADTARLRLAGGLYDVRRYSQARIVVTAAAAHADHATEVQVLMGLCRLREGSPEAARNHFDAATAQGYAPADLLLTASADYDDIPEKRPWLAGTCSAILPGSGQLYVRRPHDAMWAFLLNGVFLGATLYAFDNDETVAGVFSASLTAVWYTGNIYNAVNGAWKYNRHQQDVFFETLERQTLYDDDSRMYRLFFRIPIGREDRGTGGL